MVFLAGIERFRSQFRPTFAHGEPGRCWPGSTGAVQTLAAFRPLLKPWAGRGAAHRLHLYHDLLDAIATHSVADRPDRCEPRVKKRRRNHYGWLTRPRAEMKRRMAKGGTEKLVPVDDAPDAWSQRAMDRDAIRLALEECGYLHYTRGRILPPITGRKVASNA